LRLILHAILAIALLAVPAHGKRLAGITLPEPIEQIFTVIREPVLAGDLSDVLDLPGKIVDVFRKGEFKSMIEGDPAFQRALFVIWPGDKPARKKLKSGMLGN
jgi:hypothetical protein